MTGEPYVVRLAFGLPRPRHGIPLDEASDALRYVAAGHTRRKVVITD